MDQDAMYAAILSRERSPANHFFYGVKSTGIFCLPWCPSKKPKIENTTYFNNSNEALSQQFRPCKRCRPTSSEELPVVEFRKNVVQSIEEHVILTGELNIAHIARLINLSERHLRRIIKSETGLSLKAFLQQFQQ